MANDSHDSAAQKGEVVKIIKNAQTNKFDSDIISAIDKANDTYRWYMCTHTLPAEWTCERKNAYEIIGDISQPINNKKSTTMIPIYKFIPSVFDNMIVQRNIRSMTHVKVIQ